MVNQLHYKGYTGSVCFSEPDGILWGKVLGIRDSISFEGETIESLTNDFHIAIDDYLELCAEIGKQPQKSR
jgi:predicted HicB family RNase H-like nuclease